MTKISFSLLMFFTSLFSISSNAQCIVDSDPFPVHTADNFGLVETLNIVIYTGDLFNVNNLIIGNNYEFTCIETGASAHKFITVTDMSNTVIAFGESPLVVNAITSSEVKLHYTNNAACDVTFGIANTGTVQCVSPSCQAPALTNDDCAGAIDLDAYFNLDDTCTIIYEGTNVGATNSSTEINPSTECTDSDAAPADVWFSLTVPANGMFSYDHIDSPGVSSVVEVYTGTCGNLSPLDPVNCTSLFDEKDFTGLTPGDTVYLRYWDFESNDEGAFSFCLKDKATLSVSSNSINNTEIYPNPVANELTISNKNTIIDTIVLYNLVGQKVLSVHPNSSTSSINVTSLNSGAYFVKVTSNGTSETLKVIKQ